VNLRIVLRVLGIFLILLAGIMIIPLMWAVHYKEPLHYFLVPIAVTLLSGILIFLCFRKAHGELYPKEGFAVVGMGWILSSVFGCLPYLVSNTLPTFADAYFETMSGFTTTGATVMTNIEATAKCVLFWRSLTHWLGGMGIIVLFVAVFPFLGVGGRYLLRSEVPGPVADDIKPRIKETARMLWILYIGLTIVQTTLLMFGGMDLFESLCHTFGTLATGGFSTRNASIGSYGSAYIEWVIIVFMLMAGMNFSLYYALVKRRWRAFYSNTELRVYLSIFLAGAVIATVCICRNNLVSGVSEGIRTAAFQVASILTTTGFVTTDFDQWPSMLKVMLVTFMFIGGCAGSTGGGLKVIRIIILYKFMVSEIVKKANPGAVTTVKIAGAKVERHVIESVMGLFVLAICIFIVAVFLISMRDVDLITAVSSVAATLWNIGPGLSKVGAACNYEFMDTFSKLLLAHCMLLGRLELFTIAVLFAPSFWRK
jgi:trk system potassium uptake protein TrkH